MQILFRFSYFLFSSLSLSGIRPSILRFPLSLLSRRPSGVTTCVLVNSTTFPAFICVHPYCMKRVQTSSQYIETVLPYRKKRFLSCRVYTNAKPTTTVQYHLPHQPPCLLHHVSSSLSDLRRTVYNQHSPYHRARRGELKTAEIR